MVDAAPRRADHDAAAALLARGLLHLGGKPFTTDIGQAAALVAAARESGALLAGGLHVQILPGCALAAGQIPRHVRGWRRDLGRAEFPRRVGTALTAGLYFYGGHTAEILTTAFGPDIISVKADVTAGNVIAVFKYASLGVCVNFAEVSEFHAALYGAKEVAVHSIDISTIYRQGFAKFVQGVLTRTPPSPTARCCARCRF